MQLLDAQHTYFVGWDAGDFAVDADLASVAGLPPGTQPVGQFPALPGSSTMWVFQTPAGSTDMDNELSVVIVEPLGNGQVNLWLSGTSLARGQREEAEEDMAEYLAIGSGHYKIFERR